MRHGEDIVCAFAKAREWVGVASPNYANIITERETGAIIWSLYIHLNKVNNKCYVGITSQEPKVRWANGHGYSRKLPIGRAIEKYGWDGFKHIILFDNILSESEAKEMEVLLIRLMGTKNPECGYNLTDGGDGTRGYKHTEKTRQLLSKLNKGEAHCNYGKHLSEATREKISDRLQGNKNCVGVIRSETTRQKMSNSKKKPVIMLLNGTETSRFPSAKDAEEATKISRKNISMCCKGIRKRAGGYEWKFA